MMRFVQVYRCTKCDEPIFRLTETKDPVAGAPGNFQVPGNHVRNEGAATFGFCGQFKWTATYKLMEEENV